MKKLRIYLDTSVIGGYFDDEFSAFSQLLIRQCKAGKFTTLISPVLIEELEKAPIWIQDVLKSIPIEYSERLAFHPSIKSLAEKYLIRKVLPKKSDVDALHIAYATYFGADILVSWNFKHIVNFQRIHLIHAVNIENHYQPIDIFSPREVLGC